MSTPGRIVAGIVVVVLIVAVALLEVVSERVRVEPAFPEPAPAYFADSEIQEQPGIILTEPREIERSIVLQNGVLQDGRLADTGADR